MTAVILRPDASGYSGWTITGAATAHAALNDSSDASYVEATVSATPMLLDIGTVALPAGSVTVSGSITFRCMAPVRGVTGAFKDGNGTLVSSALLSAAAATTVTSSVGAIQLSQAEVDRSFIELTAGDIGDRVYDAYVNLVYATQPVCAVSAPTGVIGLTSTPTITWTHTAGSDGGSQTRYDARVFSAAEYGVSGFAPGTSPYTWSSGEVASSATSATSGTLANSSTYRAYVRTAQTINGQPHWSEWAYSGFTTSFTTSDITSVTVTGDNTNARHRITVTRNAATPNWITFDVERSDDAGTTWVAVRGATAATPPGDAWIGYDYEGTNGTAAIFRARASTALITGPWTTSTGATWTSTSHWLKNLRSPGESMELEISEMPQRKWAITQGVHRPVGRADPVVVSDVRQLHEATITFETYTTAEADELRTLLDAGVLLLQIAPGIGYANIYLVAGGVSEEHGSEQIGSTWRYITANYVEVATPPDDGVASTGLTWTDVVASYATWTALIAAVPTWGDLI